jgi:hypothetical protein
MTKSNAELAVDFGNYIQGQGITAYVERQVYLNGGYIKDLYFEGDGKKGTSVPLSALKVMVFKWLKSVKIPKSGKQAENIAKEWSKQVPHIDV